MDIKEVLQQIIDAMVSAVSNAFAHVFTKVIIGGVLSGVIVVVFDDPFKELFCFGDECLTKKETVQKVFVFPHQMSLVPPYEQSYYLVYKDNAVLQGDKRGEGINLDRFQSDWLKMFHGALKACSEYSQVKVKILGYASSAEFMENGVISPDSDKLNRMVANLRAKKVASLLPEDKNLFVSVKEWESYEEMEKSRPYVDRFTDEDITDQQMLNRSVSIKISDLGNCTKPEFSVSSIE